MKKSLAVLLASALSVVAAGPPGIKVSELPAGTNANGDDLVLIVQNPSTAPTTKKLTVAEFLSGQTFSNSTMFNVNLYNPIFAGLDITNLIVSVAGQGSNSIANSFGTGTNTLLYAPTVQSNNIILVHGTTNTPYATLALANAASTNGDAIRVLAGRYGGHDLGKHGVDWYFDAGASVYYDGGGQGADSEAIFTDNPVATWLGVFAEASNSASFNICGRVTATNLTGSFAKFAGVRSRINIEFDKLSSANPHGDVVLMSLLSDYYTFPFTATNADAQFTIKGNSFCGSLYLSEHAAEANVATWTNTLFYLDRDSNAERPNTIRIYGREAIDCYIFCGRPFNSGAAVFDIPLFRQGPSFVFQSSFTMDSIATVESGTLELRNMTLIQNTSATNAVFNIRSGGTYAETDHTNAGRIVFNNCNVIGRTGNTNQLIKWSNPGNTSNNPAFYIMGQLAYVNAAVTALPTQGGPGLLVHVPELTNYYTGGKGLLSFSGAIPLHLNSILHSSGVRTNYAETSVSATAQKEVIRAAIGSGTPNWEWVDRDVPAAPWLQLWSTTDGLNTFYPEVWMSWPYIMHGFTFTNGGAAGKILQCDDGFGNATWHTPSFDASVLTAGTIPSARLTGVNHTNLTLQGTSTNNTAYNPSTNLTVVLNTVLTNGTRRAMFFTSVSYDDSADGTVDIAVYQQGGITNFYSKHGVIFPGTGGAIMQYGLMAPLSPNDRYFVRTTGVGFTAAAVLEGPSYLVEQ